MKNIKYTQWNILKMTKSSITNNNFTIKEQGTDRSYTGTGSINGSILIIRAHNNQHGTHDMFCDLETPQNSYCYYYNQGSSSDRVNATIKNIDHNENTISFTWIENGSFWYIEGEI